ncbi:MAG: amidase family protein [Pseudomonadota bacterium]|nr:amidase family protein [Pseudomonadota bacterium]
MSTPVHDLSATELGAAMRAGDLDPVAVAEHFLARIDELDANHAIFVRTTPERALAEAMAARARLAAGRPLSAMDGVPVGWKDLFDTAGILTEGASQLFEGRVPDRDAVALQRATAAGMVCLGKTNLPDLAYSGLGVNPWAGTPVNPHSPAGDPRVPGGSSSGAGVSVAMRLAPIGIGSDTGGSVRIPAAYNGVVGLKTTWGAIPLDGAIPLAPSLDTVGPLTRTVADANAMFAIMAAKKPADLAGASLKGVRLLRAVGHDEAELQKGVKAAVDAAVEILRAAGATVVERRLDAFDAVDELVSRHGNPITLEGWALWCEAVDRNPDKLFRPIRERIAAGRDGSALDAETLRRRLVDMKQAYLAATGGFDGVIQATVPVVAPSIARVEKDPAEHGRQAVLSSWNTRRGNYLGLCGLTLPCGTSDGLPVGLMVNGRPFGEGALLRLGAAIEAAFAG